MSDASQPRSLDELLTHADWVRRLALRLVHDPARADDLAQDVWLTALREPPVALERPRAWLATVACTLSFTRGRADGRRARREVGHEVPAHAASALDVVVEAERQREVARLVLELDEPYRTVLLLRFYRDLPPRRIATELGRPVATVKVQIQRGLERLRARLDREHGGRSAWCALLLPLTVRKAGSTVVAGFASWAAILVVALGGWWAISRVTAAQVAPATLADARPDPVEGAEILSRPVHTVPDAPPRSSRARQPLETAPTPAAAQAIATLIPSPELKPLRARLIALDGEPLAGVRVVARDPGRLTLSSGDALVARDLWLAVPADVRGNDGASLMRREAFLAAHFVDPSEARLVLAGTPPPPASAITTANGSFTLDVSVSWAEVELDDSRYALVGYGPPRTRTGDETKLFFATESVPLAGRVVVDLDEGVAGCVVTAVPDCPPQASELLAMGSALQTVAARTETGPDGSFAFAGVPRASRVWVGAQYEGGSFGRFLDLSGDGLPAELRLVMIPPPDGERLTLAGTVVGPEGRPVPGARVAFAGVVAITDGTGSFRLAVAYWNEDCSLAVAVPGYAPLLDRGCGRALRGSTGLVTLPPLRLGDPRHVIEGRVVDADGRPIAGIDVDLRDASYLAGMDDSLEDIAAGRTLGAVETDDTGRFVLGGLLDREYTLAVAGHSSHGPFRSAPAGTSEHRLVYTPRQEER